jgi:hypothetical protein
VEVASDGTDHHLSRVQAYPDLNRHALRPVNLLGISRYRLVHPERREAGTDGVVLVGDGGAEERHDAVAHHLVDRALVAVDGLHHPLENGVQQLARLLGVTVGQKLHGALQVGEEHGDLFALALERALRRQDLLGEVLGSVGVRRPEATCSGRGAHSVPALQAELRAGGEVRGALSAFLGEPRPALQTELCLGWVLVLAPRTPHLGLQRAGPVRGRSQRG